MMPFCRELFYLWKSIVFILVVPPCHKICKRHLCYLRLGKRNKFYNLFSFDLRRYDTVKPVYEISLNFPELFIKGKYVKIRFKNRGSPCYFVSFIGQKIKNITKIERKRLFLFTFLVSFFMAFLAQKLIYTIITRFNFVFGSFFKQDHLINLFISGVYA